MVIRETQVVCRRSNRWLFVPSLSGGFEAYGSRQPLLSFVESPESLCLEVERYGYMERVEGPNGHLCSVFTSQLRAEVECRFRHGNFGPQVAFAVVLKPSMYKVNLGSRRDFPEDLLLDRVSPLGNVKRGEPYCGVTRYQPVGLSRVLIGHVE